MWNKILDICIAKHGYLYLTQMLIDLLLPESTSWQSCRIACFSEGFSHSVQHFSAAVTKDNCCVHYCLMFKQHIQPWVPLTMCSTLSISKCYSLWCLMWLTWSWNSASRVGSLRWWDSVLRKPGNFTANGLLLAFLPPSSLFSFLPVSFLFILPAQFQCSGYEHIQVEQPLSLLNGKWHGGLVINWLRNRGSGGNRLRSRGRKKRWLEGGRRLRRLRRKWRGGGWGEK